MPEEIDSLTELRDAVSGILANDTSFSASPAVVPINEESGDIQSILAINLKNKPGVMCVVSTPTLAPGESNFVVKARVRVDFYENVLINRNGTGFKTAPKLLICSYNLLANKPTGSNEWKDLVFVDHRFEVKGNSIHHTLFFDAEMLT